MLNIHKTAAYDERLSTSSTVDEWNASCGAFTTRLTIRADCPSIMTMDSYGTGEDGPFITMAGATEVRSSQTLSKETTVRDTLRYKMIVSHVCLTLPLSISWLARPPSYGNALTVS